MRVIVPDSHGNHIDPSAEKAFLRDLKAIAPREIVMLGDHLDCGGLFSAHQRTYTAEMTESYEDDCMAANSLLDAIQKAAPRATIHYIEGNHEQHVERWVARNFERRRDAEALLEVWGPEKKLQLRRRGIRYYKRSRHYMGCSIPGTIRLGKCFFTHGICAGQQATYQHLVRFGDNVVHGHTHRAASYHTKTVRSEGHGAWSPGTLAELQPLYQHAAPSGWSQGYALQEVAKSGRFLHIHVPIVGGESLLLGAVKALK